MDKQRIAITLPLTKAEVLLLIYWAEVNAVNFGLTEDEEKLHQRLEHILESIEREEKK